MTEPKTALITGQDGSFLADLLLAQGYRVIGLARRSTKKDALSCLTVEAPTFTCGEYVTFNNR